MIRAGALRHIRHLYRVTKTGRDEAGQKIAVPELITPFRCEILTAVQAEKRLANGMFQPHQVVFHCRYIPNVEYTPDVLVQHQGIMLNVTKIDNPGGLNKELFITAEQKINDRKPE